MNTITTDENLVAYCGLYCGACKVYLSGRCPGCRENTKASWCKVRACCINSGYTSCVDCTTHPDPRQCAGYNNLVSRLFGFVFRSNRAACIERIRTVGKETFAAEMAASRRESLPR